MKCLAVQALQIDGCFCHVLLYSVQMFNSLHLTCRPEKERDLPAAYRIRRDSESYRERSPIRRPQPPTQSTSRPVVHDLFDAYSTIAAPVVTDIRDLICKPKRDSRPAHICLIVRGPPGAGKTYCSKLIRDTESSNGGSAPRILNLDDYFMVEVERLVTDDETGKKIKRKVSRSIKKLLFVLQNCMNYELASFVFI